MADLPVPQAALVQCMGTLDSQLTIIDLSFVNSGAVTPLNLQALAESVAFWFQATLAPQLSEDWAATRAVAIDLSDPTGSRFEVDAAATGGVASESAPNNVAACVSFRTAQRGRSGRGRNFLPGVPGSAITLNTLSSGFISNIITVYGGLIGAGTFVPSWQWCVVSRVSAGVDRTPPITIPITSVTFVTDKVRSMRSREVGHGA